MTIALPGTAAELAPAEAQPFETNQLGWWLELVAAKEAVAYIIDMPYNPDELEALDADACVNAMFLGDLVMAQFKQRQNIDYLRQEQIVKSIQFRRGQIVWPEYQHESLFVIPINPEVVAAMLASADTRLNMTDFLLITSDTP